MPQSAGLPWNESHKWKTDPSNINKTPAGKPAVKRESWGDVDLAISETSNASTNQQSPTSFVCNESGKVLRRELSNLTGYESRSELEPQVVIRLSSNIEEPYQCGICHITYSCPQMLYTHILTNHKRHTKMPEPVINGFEGTYCHMSSNSEGNLDIKDEDETEEPAEYIIPSSHSDTVESDLCGRLAMESDDIAPTYDESSTSSTCNNEGKGSMLSNIALMVAKIVANQEALGRRIGKIERNVALILGAMSTKSSNAVKSVDMPQSRALTSRFKPINTIDELNAFEQKLKNPVFYHELFEKIKLACNDATLSEINLSYTIVDAMFARPLFLHISWLGGTKSDVRKIAFKNYKRTLGFFIAIVRIHHPNWSDISMEEFFKRKIISCATARAKTTPKRLSREKHRKNNETICDGRQRRRDA